MEYLEEYYNNYFKVDGMPDFEELSLADKKYLSNNLGYHQFSIAKRMHNFAEAAGLKIEEVINGLAKM